MVKKLVSIAVAIALLGIGTVVGSVLSSSPHAFAKGTHIKAFNPDSKVVENNVNAGPKDEKEGLGDYFVGYGPLLDGPGGKKIGNEKHHCWNYGGTQSTFTALCDATFWLDGRGKIMGYGSFTARFSENGPTGVPKLAITGGTGDFRGDTGTISLHFKPHGITFEFNVTG